MKDILDRIKEACHTGSCRECRLCDVCKTPPYSWDTEAIRKALNETVDEPKAEIVVPKMIPSIYTGKDLEKTGYIDEVARWKIDEIIMCLQQIKERIDEVV